MIFNFLLDPNIAYVVIASAVVLTVLALFSPGSGFLEAAALLALLAGGYSIANLPVNSWALVTMLGGIILVVVTIYRKVKWFFLAAAVALILLGSAFLFQNGDSPFSADALLVLIGSVSLGGFIWIIGRSAGRAFQQKPHSGLERLDGMTGRAVTDIHQSGSVYVAGEEWSAESDTPIRSGSKVSVRSHTGFILKVEKVNQPQLAEKGRRKNV